MYRAGYKQERWWRMDAPLTLTLALAPTLTLALTLTLTQVHTPRKPEWLPSIYRRLPALYRRAPSNHGPAPSIYGPAPSNNGPCRPARLRLPSEAAATFHRWAEGGAVHQWAEEASHG